MLSFGWAEILLVFIVVIIFVGPKELPKLIKQLSSFTKSIKKSLISSRDWYKLLKKKSIFGNIKVNWYLKVSSIRIKAIIEIITINKILK